MNESAALRQRTQQLPVRRWGNPKWRALLLFAVLGWLWFVLCRQLSYEWSANEQYSYGWFVPFFALFLFGLRWEDWGEVERRKAKVERAERARIPIFLVSTLAFLLLAALLPIRLFEIANPDWRPLSWGQALLVVGYTLVVIGYYFRPAGRPSAESGWQPDFRFNWRAVWHFAVPVCFILVAVPWLTPIEAPLVQGLMRLVAAVATETLTLCGIPAQLEGSLIRVNNGVVGVSEACSGVRSLQTSLMIGLLFGELKRLTIARRFVLLGVVLAIALFANFGRAFFLVWIAATENLAAVERRHDIAGYAIVGLVFLGTIAIASALAKGMGKVEGRKAKGERSVGAAASIPPSAFRLSQRSFSFLL